MPGIILYYNYYKGRSRVASGRETAEAVYRCMHDIGIAILLKLTFVIINNEVNKTEGWG